MHHRDIPLTTISHRGCETLWAMKFPFVFQKYYYTHSAAQKMTRVSFLFVNKDNPLQKIKTLLSLPYSLYFILPLNTYSKIKLHKIPCHQGIWGLLPLHSGSHAHISIWQIMWSITHMLNNQLHPRTHIIHKQGIKTLIHEFHTVWNYRFDSPNNRRLLASSPCNVLRTQPRTF